MSNKNLLPKILATMVLAVIFTVIGLMFSPLKSDLQDWLALEYNSHINELMTSPNNYLMSEPEPIIGKSTNSSQIITNEINDENSMLDIWFDRSQTKALIVQRQGKIVYERYEGDVKQGLNVNGMSMAKSVIAILIGIAIDDELINSEKDPISIYLPELTSSKYNRVEIRDLLRHTSGIQSSNRDLQDTLNNKLLNLSTRDLLFSDDKSFSYDNMNYHLLMLILQRLYQKPINEIIEAKVWQSLRLEDASIVTSSGLLLFICHSKVMVSYR